MDRIYGELPAARERWPIPWLECDGDQWHPSHRARLRRRRPRRANESGSQGILGIHWRTRDIEENLAFLVDYAWQPGLTAEAFFEQLAARCYPPAIRPRHGADPFPTRQPGLALGWRRRPDRVRREFQFGPGTPEKIGQLQSLRGELAALLPKAGQSERRVRWLLARWTGRWRIRMPKSRP